MSIPTKSQRWALQEKPHGEPVLDGAKSTFALEEVDLPELKDSQVLLKTLYLSNDPAQRTWIAANADVDRLYMPPVKVGETMRAFAIAEVVQSRSADVPEGSLVTGGTGWRDYSVADAKSVAIVEDQEGLPPTHFLGALGLPGYTAYHGLYEIAKVGPKDAIVISGAAGAVGTMAVQIAKKMIGCRKVIGLAGTDDKCKLVEKLGADVCLNYKSPTWKEDLTKATEGFVEVYFDNVGGEILDFMLSRLAKFGRVAACGTISNYNKADQTGLKNFFEVVTMRLEIKGFIVIDAAQHMPKARAHLVEEWKKGNLVINDESETVVDTDFADIPKTWLMLYSGGNTGKLITKLKY